MSDESPDPVPEQPGEQPVEAPPIVEAPRPTGGFDYSQPPAPQQAYAPVETDAIGHLIPTKNPKALTAYYCGVFSFVPCFTPILGPLAIVLGFLGLKAVKERPGLPGKGHAITGIILGGVTTLAAIALVLVVLIYGHSS